MSLSHCVRSLYRHSLRGAGIRAVFVSSFRDAGTVDPVSPVLSVCDGRRFPFPFVFAKNGGGFLFPSPSPVLVEPIPYLDDEAHEGDGEGDFHGDG